MSTIAAISTPNAAGGIGIVRLSGEDAFNIIEKCFKPFSGKKIGGMKGYTAAYGQVRDGEKIIDEAVLIIYRAPKSYTGENVAEICCHGGLYILQRVLRLALSLGASPAEAGEFTKRAYLNGKMDLSQAESVMTLISANGEAAMNAARNALEGSVSRKINAVCSSLVSCSASLAAWTDYPDEDIPEIENEELLKVTTEAKEELNKLIKNYDGGKAVTEGVNTVICGKPNVGKSTLMNLISGCPRSIVASAAGTTRDVVEETVRVGDIVLRLADTAGIRVTSDEVENMGVERAVNKIKNADLILAVFDVSRALSLEDRRLIELCKHKNCLAIINKTDLEAFFCVEDIKKHIPDTVCISAKNEKDAEKLIGPLEKLLGTGEIDFSQELLTAERQYNCCVRAFEDLCEAQNALLSGLTADAVNVSIDCAVEELLTLTGKKATEEIVNGIFERFCVGK